MNDNDRKLLTEFLGECLFNEDNFDDDGMCNDCRECAEAHTNRTFTTAADMMAVKRRLVEVGKIKKFEEWAYDKWEQEYCYGDVEQCFTDWLMDETRFCQLAAEFRREDA